MIDVNTRRRAPAARLDTRVRRRAQRMRRRQQRLRFGAIPSNTVRSVADRLIGASQ